MSSLADMFSMDLPVPHEDGSFISERVSRVAELVNSYDRHVSVRWIPPSQRADGEPAFAIVYESDDGSSYVVFYVQSEEEFDGRVLQRLQEGDQIAQGGKVLSEMDARNEAIKSIAAARHKEEVDAATDLAYHILRSAKHTYKHDGVEYT